MHTYKFLTIIIVIILMLTACTYPQSSINSESINKSNIVKNNSFLANSKINDVIKIEEIQFPAVFGYLFPGYNSVLSWWSELTFFGTVTGNFSNLSNNYIADNLNKFYNANSMLNANGNSVKLVSSRWIVSGSDTNERKIRLLVQCEDVPTEMLKINSITIMNNQALKEIPIGEYTILPTMYTEPINAFVHENILEFVDAVSNDMIITIWVAIPSDHKEEDLNFDVKISDNQEIISAEVINWKFDEIITQEAKSYYETIKTPQELKNFRIYSIDINVKTNTKEVVVQPCIIVKYGNSEYNCITEPFTYKIG